MAQSGYWQQHVDYTIHVSLNDKDNTLDADEQIVYTNNSPDTLTYIFFHLWPNAYKNDKTAFSEQLLRNNNTDFYFSNEDQRGYINRIQFTVNNKPAEFNVDSTHIDIAKLILPQPVLPRESIVISTPFHVKLPYDFSRSGHEGQTYQIAQWYPKPAVYDKYGWHTMPYLDQGEFYSEFGSFKVFITVPDNYMIAASGDLQNGEELNKLKALGKMPATEQPNYKLWNNNYKAQAVKEKKPFVDVMPPSSITTKTLQYTLDSVHDFAWFASKLFLIQYDTIQLPAHSVDAFTFYNPWNKNNWQNSLQYVKSAVHFYSAQLGEYPYDEVSAVLGDAGKENGGMEYPAVTLIEMSNSNKELDATLAHEIGHNWLYGIVASNERDHAWMDEGINTFYEHRYVNQRYDSRKEARFPYTKLPADEDKVALETMVKLHKDQPIELTSDSFTFSNYNLIVYSKTAMWLHQVEQKMGRATFDSCMKNYYGQWKYKHPYPADFQQSLQTCSNEELSPFFNTLTTTGSLFTPKQKTLKPTFLFNESATDKYNYISFLPAFGYNYYDKIMIGAMVHNYQFPLHRFQFFIAPLYATASHTLNGASRFSFNTFKKRTWLELSLSGMKYDINSFTQYDGSKLFFNMTRIVPSVKYRIYNKDLRSTQRWTFTARSFLIREQTFGTFKSVVVAPDTFYVADKQNTNRYVNEFRASVSDNRKLYPYNANLTIDQGKTFLRAGFTGNYFFNYIEKNKGIQARFFAGKFFYLQQKTLLSKSDNDRYLLTLSGPDGNHDYTYSDYFLGRNEYEGGLSQQIMQRDGFFKVSTPLLSEAIGVTDNWLLALNISGDIPGEINPLNLLPVKLPIQFFIDVGTYSDVWKNDNSNGRFLYDAGLKVSVLNSAFSIYVPLLYSKVYGDYYKSFYPDNRFRHTISLGFNLRQFKPNRLYRDLPL